MSWTNFPNGVTSFGVPVLGGGGIPFGPSSQVFFVDPANGNNADDGLTPQTAVASVATAYAKTTSGNNDVIFFIGGATANTLTTALTWSNSYTHLIGLSSPIPGEGQRCRIVASAANDVADLITVSGTGCIFQNLKISNESDANVDSGALVVSGSRNAFINVQAAGMVHATPAARAGSYSCKVTGAENFFERCTIGTDTIVRGAANAELVVSGTRNRFWDCEFTSASETAGKFAVTVAEGVDRFVEFKDCTFRNFSANWAQALTDAINVTAASTHYIVLRGLNQLVGYTGWANVVTHVYSAAPASNAGFGTAVNPTT